MALKPIPYKNPVWPGYFADPFVIRAGADYFAYGTGSDVNHGLQFDGRMFPVLRSSDLVNWTQLGGALEPLNGDVSALHWAPEVAECDGVYYMYYAHNMRLRVATARNPAGPFIDTGRDIFPNEPFSIDASPFYDPREKRWYLFFAKDFFDGRVGTGTAVVRLADDMMTPTSTPMTVVRASSDWQIYQRNRRWYDRDWEAWHTVEGPFVLEYEGRYYCLYSGGCWETADYGVSYAVADHPLGPWFDEWSSEGPAVLRGIPDKVLGPGHNSVIRGPDGKTDFVVYHAWDAQKSARRLCIDPLIFSEKGPRCDGPSTELRTLHAPEAGR